MPSESNMPLQVLVLYPQLFASPIVNILTPLRHLAQQGTIILDHCREDHVIPQQVRSADVLVVCRSASPTFKPIYEYAISLGIPIIYDLDDNLLAIPEDSEAYRYFGHPDKQKHLKWIIGKADLVRVHSTTLVNVIRQINEQVKEVWSAVDWTLVPENLPDLQTPLEVVYAVSPYSGAMFYSIIRDDIMRLLNDYSDDVRFYMMGYKEPELAQMSNCIYIPFEDEYTTFFNDFTRHGYAIGLAPMKHDLFYECKTDIKFRDYAAAGAVGIYTNSPLYKQVEDGITGIIVDNASGNWYSAIVNLLKNPHKLNTIRQEARRFAFERYHVDSTSQVWLKDLQSLEHKPSIPELSHPQSWWFTKDPKLTNNRFAKSRRLYNRVVPFRLHVIVSRVYHHTKKVLAAIPKLPR